MGIHSDVNKLTEDYGLSVATTIDLCSLAIDCGMIELRNAGLMNLAKEVLGKKIEGELIPALSSAICFHWLSYCCCCGLIVGLEFALLLLWTAISTCKIHGCSAERLVAGIYCPIVFAASVCCLMVYIAILYATMVVGFCGGFSFIGGLMVDLLKMRGGLMVDLFSGFFIPFWLLLENGVNLVATRGWSGCCRRLLWFVQLVEGCCMVLIAGW
ncbi:hypothetical protein LOK49_LG01G02542 [Camellia lanceoleosa]|uniref:Uncharacterized protein n=1 Tax=Camellia lanceoleosa TaxID=1840588 RepID=A0ACC0J0D7_9ERIC|nr:hypothetical protein LOK49_LG01G02542 [Camellia lanceoleosa]